MTIVRDAGLPPWRGAALRTVAGAAVAGLLLCLAGCAPAHQNTAPPSTLAAVAQSGKGAAAHARAGSLAVVSRVSAHGASGTGTSARVGSAGRRGSGAGNREEGRWYRFSGGRPVAVSGPAAGGVSFKPWTVQTRVAGFLNVGPTLFLAVNGWGLLAMEDMSASKVSGKSARPASSAAQAASQLHDRSAPGLSSSEWIFRPTENRRLFAGRTINGFDAAGGGVLIHLYHNTVFDTKPPLSPPVAYVRFDPAAGSLTGVALPLTREGWEAIQAISTPGGSWALAWKRTGSDRVRFRYTRYNPQTGEERSIDRNAFVAAYGFQEISRAPAAIQAIAQAALRRTSGTTVVHLLAREAPFARTHRYRSGNEALLDSGDASLLTVRVQRSARRYYALLPHGRLLVSSAPTAGSPRASAQDSRPTEMQLPRLPSGFVYTDVWTDGRVLVVSWEQQRFTRVGAAGLYVVALGDLPAP